MRKLLLKFVRRTLMDQRFRIYLEAGRSLHGRHPAPFGMRIAGQTPRPTIFGPALEVVQEVKKSADDATATSPSATAAGGQVCAVYVVAAICALCPVTCPHPPFSNTVESSQQS